MENLKTHFVQYAIFLSEITLKVAPTIVWVVGMGGFCKMIMLI